MHPFSADASTIAAQQNQKLRRKESGSLSSSKPGLGSTRLPTYIDYSSLDGVDGTDDKYRKGGAGWRNRLIGRANGARGWFGALQRTAIRAGILEGKFWRRALLGLLLVVLAGLALFNRFYETHIELAFYSRNWVDRVIKPVPPLSGTCFSGLAAGYNYSSTAVTTPNHLLLNPGISMRFGLDCYHFSRQLPSIAVPGQVLPEFVTYHLYWRADLAALGERQILLLKSVLATQEPISKASVILWTNDVDAISANPLLQPVLAKVGSSRLSIKHADFHSLARGTPMENHALLSKGGTDARAWIDGDLIRILVLYAYGGIWVDMDTLLLRSFYPLLEQEFVTQWDCYDKPYSPLNGAIMHFYSRSPYLCEMMHIMATGPPPRPGTTDWGSILYHQLHRRLVQAGIRPFTILPYCLTDGRSCTLANRLPDPFKKDEKMIREDRGAREELEMKVSSVFSIHLHNQWDKIWPKDGWMDRLVVKQIEEKWERL